jgi:SNF2 family DNA or RNA helicase
MEQIQAVQRRKREIERERFNRQAELEKKERIVREAKHKLDEAKRFRTMEQEKASNFQLMVDKAKAANYEWVQYAKPHQWEGALSLAHYGSAILADETGLGKTLTSIMSLDLKESKKVLILTESNIASNFYTEILTYAPHRNLIPIANVTKGMRATIKTLVENSNEFVVVTNYESLWRDDKWLAGVDWDDIFIDEAHNAKNEKGLTFNAIDGFNYKNCTPITATYILNSPGDLYAPLHLIDPVAFNDKEAFLWTYCIQDFDGKWTFRPGGEKKLTKQLGGRIIRRSYLEANEKLPEQHISEILIPEDMVSNQQLKMMQEIDRQAAIMLESGEKIGIDAMIAVITRSRQAATYPAGIEVKVTEKMKERDWSLPPVGTVIFKVPDDTPSIKIEIGARRIAEMVKKGHRTVVFSQFKTCLEGMEKALKEKGIRVVRFDGDTKQALRVEIKKDFLRPGDGSKKTDYKYDVVLANYKTGGSGLNFTDATYMLQTDEEWNPSKNHQARSRIHRIGQTEETFVEIMRIDKSIDMWMKTLNEKKQAIINGFEDEVGLMESLKSFFADRNFAKKPIEPELMDLDEEFDPAFLKMLEEL